MPWHAHCHRESGIINLLIREIKEMSKQVIQRAVNTSCKGRYRKIVSRRSLGFAQFGSVRDNCRDLILWRVPDVPDRT
jgi:hypothetical protein